LAFGLRNVRGRPRPGGKGQFFEGRLGAGDEAVGQVGVAHIVGVEVPLGQQIGSGGGGDDEFKHGRDVVWRCGF